MIKNLIKFENVALSNDLLEEKDDKAHLHDLDVVFDDDTKLVFVRNNVEADKMFNSTYVYDSSRSTTMNKHFEEAAFTLQKIFTPKSSLEIGSNSGIFIKHFPRKNIIAVEPCRNFAELTNSMGIKTYPNFWDLSTTEQIISENGKIDLIFSANTFSHVQNLNECFSLVEKTLTDEGVFALESPSLLELLQGNAFDQFYHEHQSYFSYIAVSNIARQEGLRIFDLEMYPVHGGTYRFLMCKNSAGHKESTSINRFHEDELSFGVDSYDKLLSCIGSMEQNMTNIKSLIENIKQQNKTVVGYGATAKFTNVMNMCKLNHEHIDFVFDTTPIKQYKWIPNTGVQIKPYSPLEINKIDYFYLGAWNYRNEIISKEREFLKRGGKFITHIPDVKLIKA